jgi:hypothetical protein
MSTPFKLTEYDAVTGIRTTVHQTENRVVIQKTEDVEPILQATAAEREWNQGQRWGEGMKKVGTVPMSVVAKFMRQDGGFDSKRCAQWLKENPAFVTYDRFLLK